MKLFVFSMYDTKTEIYGVPHFMKSQGEALRAVMDMLLEDNLISRHPEDFILFQLGTFDDSDGTFTEVKKSLCHVIDLKKGD